jgi:hypothetical protein
MPTCMWQAVVHFNQGAHGNFGISLLTCLYIEVSLGFQITGMDMIFHARFHFTHGYEIKSIPAPTGED